eukprot:gene13889-biopygen3804
MYFLTHSPEQLVALHFKIPCIPSMRHCATLVLPGLTTLFVARTYLIQWRRFARRSSSGASVPTWMAEPSAVLIKRHVRINKTEPFVDEVELLQANPHYAFVRYPDGRETTVSTKHLAPKPIFISQVQIQPQDCVPETTTVDSSVQQDVPTTTHQASIPANSEHTLLRRSERIWRPVDRLDI